MVLTSVYVTVGIHLYKLKYKLKLRRLKYQGDPLCGVFTLFTFLAIKGGDRGKIF